VFGCGVEQTTLEPRWKVGECHSMRSVPHLPAAVRIAAHKTTNVCYELTPDARTPPRRTALGTNRVSLGRRVDRGWRQSRRQGKA
jgi:hypothetical protein